MSRISFQIIPKCALHFATLAWLNRIRISHNNPDPHVLGRKTGTGCVREVVPVLLISKVFNGNLKIILALRHEKL